MTTTATDQIKQLGRAVCATELHAVEALGKRINDEFVQACQLMLGCSGRVVVIGMGKSGHIGGKIAATLASTGTPAFFVHPGEASHGDLGMITEKDVVIALSNSGETTEILTILPIIKRLGIPLIALSGNCSSTLAQEATVCLDVSVAQEACPLGLAPTSSTTVTLVMGDALAVSLLKTRGFTEEDFARSHPAGTLGRRLLLRIDDLMHTGSDIPRVDSDQPISSALLEMTQKGLGMTLVCDASGKLAGLFTDGDLRRILERKIDLQATPIAEVMVRDFTVIRPGVLAAEALQIMQSKKLNGFPVVSETDELVGVFNMHDLLRAGVV